MRLSHRLLAALAALGSLLTAGCLGSAYSAQLREADQRRAELAWAPFPHAVVLPTVPPQDEAVFAGELTAEAVADAAVRRNPDVVAALERWVEALERAPQRTALPDPTLRYAYSSMFDMHTVSLMQEVPFPLKLLAEGRAALAEARAARADLAERTNQLREQAAAGVAMLALARREVALVDENIALLDRFIEVARARYVAGAGSQSDVLRAEVEREGLRVERAAYVREVGVAESALNALLDRAPDAPLGPVAAAEVPAAPPPLAALLEQALEGRPELAAFAARVDAQRERARRAELEWAPDFALGGGYVRDAMQDADEWEASGGISLPLWWGRIRAGVREAEAGERRAEAEARAARNRALEEVRGAALRLSAALEQHRLVREQALPRARQNVEVSEAAYVTGDLDFLALIDARRMLLAQQLELERTAAAAAIAAAALERATGGAAR